MAPFWSCWWGCGVERERKAFREYTQMRAARNRQETAGNLGETIIDGEVVPSSLTDIAPILRVANEVERRNPRVAYLCKFMLCFANN
ncbi:hypothetical protein FH972_009648 [Carpinus fangiana]|uniref:Uncharacterized protein n=1 Tax=Carpinus fangiana TaxID=176857 RepID=A0A660KMW2_9ROSI|nr:hypothetical protein FH972_009648 [Carpinus fangiana]